MPVLDPVGERYRWLTYDDIVTNRPCRLFKVIVITQGTGGTLTIYDNNGWAGTKIFSAPGDAPAGTIYDLNVPCTTGIGVQMGTGQTVGVVYT